MKRIFRMKSFLIPLMLLLVSCASKAADGDGKNDLAPQATVVTPEVKPVPRTCNKAMSRSERFAVIAQTVLEAVTELETNPQVVKDPEARKRVGTFAAGAIPDSAPFVTLDRRCWADFYEAQQKLEDGSFSGAQKKAYAWKACLVSTFPDRVEIAEPLISCFEGTPPEKTTESKSETK